MICGFCGTNHQVIAAPFISDMGKWTIYRPNFIEVTFTVSKNLIYDQSKELTKTEIGYIIKNILDQ